MGVPSVDRLLAGVIVRVVVGRNGWVDPFVEVAVVFKVESVGSIFRVAEDIMLGGLGGAHHIYSAVGALGRNVDAGSGVDVGYSC